MNDTLDPTLAFNTLRAELEARWLGRVFLPHREFGLMTGQQSILIMGEEGAGKTAIELQLKDYAAHRKPALLLAPWRPDLPAEIAEGVDVAEVFMPQAMDALSFAFLQAVVQDPSIYTGAPGYARSLLPWFIQRYLKEDNEYNLSRLEEFATPGGLEIATQILAASPRQFTWSAATDVLSHLMPALNSMGFEGVWIFLEGLDNLFRRYPDRVEKYLKAFLSSLELFEEPAFIFKMVVSNELGQKLQDARGVITRRFKTYELKWGKGELTGMLEKRAAATLGCDRLDLRDLVDDPAWPDWLLRFGGSTPRGWLKTASPVLAARLEKGRALASDEWLDVYRKSPPLLQVDLDNERVYIGSGQLPVLAISYQLLSYLYRNRNRACTKSELYFRAHNNLPNEPRGPGDAGWEDITGWEGVLDTALWRLRQAVEWDERKGALPVYIVSERGRRTVRLENAG